MQKLPKIHKVWFSETMLSWLDLAQLIVLMPVYILINVKSTCEFVKRRILKRQLYIIQEAFF